MPVIVGMSGEVTRTVTDNDTAIALESGTVEVLATPRIVAWCEAATMAAVGSGIRDVDVCVGTHVQIEHVQPSPVGQQVTARATVTATDGRIITFEIEAVRHDSDGETLIAHGEVVRVILNREHFFERAQASGKA
ncbi:MAG: thioesterase [Actinobacteria bacterium]|nr:thioesterase [Actinomycetota bacterium]